MCFSTPATHVLPHFTNLLKPSRHGPNRVWNKDIWVTFRWSDGKKKQIYTSNFQPLKNTPVSWVPPPKACGATLPLCEFHPSIQGTSPSALWLELHFVASLGHWQPPSRGNPLHRGWGPDIEVGWPIVPWRVSQSPDIWRCFHGKSWRFCGWLSVSCIGKKLPGSKWSAETNHVRQKYWT